MVTEKWAGRGRRGFGKEERAPDSSLEVGQGMAKRLCDSRVLQPGHKKEDNVTENSGGMGRGQGCAGP